MFGVQRNDDWTDGGISLPIAANQGCLARTIAGMYRGTMLTEDQLRTFSERGWVVQPDVFDPNSLGRYQEAFDEHIDGHSEARLQHDDIIRSIQFVVNFDVRFRDCLMAPQIIEENRQITGTELKYITSWIISRNPAPGRYEDRNALLAPDSQSWHRDLRPKWGIYPHDSDPRLINSVYNNSMVLLTDIGKDDGGTLMLDGSHRIEGSWQDLLGKCDVSQLTGSAGSVVYFSETLMHSGVAVLGERRRDVMVIAYGPPWFKTWYRSTVPDVVLADVSDELQRNILEGWDMFGYHGQHPAM
jgi:hypothetical protein